PDPRKRARIEALDKGVLDDTLSESKQAALTQAVVELLAVEFGDDVPRALRLRLDERRPARPASGRGASRSGNEAGQPGVPQPARLCLAGLLRHLGGGGLSGEHQRA